MACCRSSSPPAPPSTFAEARRATAAPGPPLPLRASPKRPATNVDMSGPLRRFGPSALQPGPKPSHGAAPMADRILLGGRELGHRAIRMLVRDEGRVVAEAAGAPWLGGQHARAPPLEDLFDVAVEIDVGDGADVCETAAGGG